MHCRNCPVYAAAGRQWLEREPSEDYLHAWTRLLAAEQAEVRAADAISVLIFRLGMAWLALPTHVCKEVAEMRAIHTLPHRSGRILLGLVNIGGEIHLCVSLSQLLGLDQATDPGEPIRQAYKRLVVVARDTDRWVLVVDEVHGIDHFHPRVLQHVSVPVPGATPMFTKGRIDWHDTGVDYLDPDLVFAALSREIA
jgi:chemotaxis-related protein WspD